MSITKLTITFSVIVFTSMAFGESKSLSEYQPKLTEAFQQLLSQADPEVGKALFERKCQTCHDYEKSGQHNTGPNLWKVVGRPAGKTSGFEYSSAMAGSNHVWTPATLNHFLTNTKKAVPGTKMTFRKIRKEKDRANLLRYLMDSSTQP